MCGLHVNYMDFRVLFHYQIFFAVVKPKNLPSYMLM